MGGTTPNSRLWMPAISILYAGIVARANFTLVSRSRLTAETTRPSSTRHAAVPWLVTPRPSTLMGSSRRTRRSQYRPPGRSDHRAPVLGNLPGHERDHVRGVVVEPFLELIGLDDPVLIPGSGEATRVVPAQRLAEPVAGPGQLVVHPMEVDEVEREVLVRGAVVAVVEALDPVHRDPGQQWLRVDVVAEPPAALLEDRAAEVDRRLGVAHVDDLDAATVDVVGGHAVDVVAEPVVVLRIGGDDLVGVAEEHDLVALEELALAGLDRVGEPRRVLDEV